MPLEFRTRWPDLLLTANCIGALLPTLATTVYRLVYPYNSCTLRYRKNAKS